MKHEPDLLSIRDAAHMLSVDYDTLLRWVNRGSIPCVLVGPHARKRVRKSEVVLLLRHQEVTTCR
jgi:excisionase family DNA binding protein